MLAHVLLELDAGDLSDEGGGTEAGLELHQNTSADGGPLTRACHAPQTHQHCPHHPGHVYLDVSATEWNFKEL